MPVTGTAAVILAAGKGTRMRSALPKVLHPLAGIPMIERVVSCAHQVAESAVVVVAPGADAVRDALIEWAPTVRFAEQVHQLGTGDAVAAALAALGEAERVVVLCGDVPLLSVGTLRRLVEEVPADAVGLVTVRLDDPSGLGRILRDDAGRVTGIVEERDATESQRAIDEINSGIYVLPAGRLREWLDRLSADNAQGEYYLTDVVAFAVAEGIPVRTVTTEDADEVAGVNDRAQLARLERIVQARSARALMVAGVSLADPERIDVRGELSAGEDCFIDVGCVFEGRVVLGRDVQIGPHCVLRDAEIADGTVIEPFTHVDGAEVGANARLGPFARLREGTRLADHVRIGNFVETKKARLGRGSKANHLAYLGDAEIGAGCNVGAGTITCNYDGVDKHLTRLGDGVFVGSNSTLVAPVEIGEGGYVAAGSTITKPVPGQALGVGRGRQFNKENWASPQVRASRREDREPD